jgi:hypothetical protein
MYRKYAEEKKRKVEITKEESSVEPMKKMSEQLAKVSNILDAFVIKVNFSLKKLNFTATDNQAKVRFVKCRP